MSADGNQYYPDVIDDIDQPLEPNDYATNMHYLSSNGAGTRQTDRQQLKEASLHISVTDPCKQEAGTLNSYITYKVKVNTQRPDYQYGNFDVIRRYRDFAWLAQKLADDYPGVILPPLPDKGLMGRFDAAFIEKRRKELERYLQRVAAHEELTLAPALEVFLNADEPALHEAQTKDQKDLKGHSAGQLAKGVFKWFDETVTVVKTQVDKVKDKETQEASKSPDDLQFDAIEKYVFSLDTQMQNVAKHCSGLVKKQDQLGQTLYDFGIAFTMLANAEEKEDETLPSLLKSMGHAVDDVSVQVRTQSLKEVDHFEQPILEYVKIIQALKNALSKRSEKRITLLTCLNSVETQQAALSKLRGVQGKEDKLALAEDQLEASKHAKDEATREFQEVSARVVKEFERFKVEKAADMKKIMLDYVNIQVEYTANQLAKWTQLKGEITTLIPQADAQHADRTFRPPARLPTATPISSI